MTKELINEFARWLERRGAQLKPIKSEWEAVRWSPSDGTTLIMYIRKTGVESFSSPAARQAWVRFLEDETETPPAPAVDYLSAAAPVMLAALRVALGSLDTYADDHDVVANQIEKAIELATKGPQ